MSTPVGVVVPNDLPSDSFVEYARRAEELGFDQLWVVEDCFLNGGVAQAAVALATTSSIRVGIGILPAGARNVAFATMDVATLANLFPDRLLVGVGHGMPKWMRQTGTWPASPLTLIGEYIEAMRAILAGDEVSRDGRYVKLQDIRLASPPSTVPPVFAGVRGPKSLAVAGRVADGTILAEPVTPEYLRAVREQVSSPRSQHEFVAYNFAAIDDSIERARDLARQSLVWIGEPDWAPHIAPLPFADEFARLRADSSTKEEFASRLPDEWVDQLAIVGTPVQARARLAELADAGADHLILMPAGPDPLAMLSQLGRVL